MDRRVAAPPYKTRLSLRRRVTDCGNPREGRDQMDRHVAALLAMTILGGEVHCHHYPTARRWSSSRNDSRGPIAMSLRSCHTTHVCHCEGGLPTAAIQGIGEIRWIATSLRSSR